MALTPAQLAKSGTEDGTQAAIIQACAQYIYPAFPLADSNYTGPTITGYDLNKGLTHLGNVKYPI